MGVLAINGGVPVKAEIGGYAGWPAGNDDMVNVVLNTLHSGVWGGFGLKCAEFAALCAQYTQSSHCLPVSNGTAALELMLRALEIGRGDEVILPPYTFTATVSAVIMTGAMPVFADIDPCTYNLCPQAAENAVTGNTKAIITVHVGGKPSDMERLKAVAKRHMVYLVEDAAQAIGSEWDGKRVGAIGDLGSFSFQETKNLPAGEGGVITTHNAALYEKMRSLHNYGRVLGAGDSSRLFPGINARMPEWQAAVLCEGMKRLDADIERRMKNAIFLDERIGMFPFLETMRKPMKETRNSYHLYMFKYKREGLDGISRETFIEALNAENVCQAANGYSVPIYENRMMYGDEFVKATGRMFSNPKESLPNNEKAARAEGVWIFHSSLLGGQSDMEMILEAMDKIWKHKHELQGRCG